MDMPLCKCVLAMFNTSKTTFSILFHTILIFSCFYYRYGFVQDFTIVDGLIVWSVFAWFWFDNSKTIKATLLYFTAVLVYKTAIRKFKLIYMSLAKNRYFCFLSPFPSQVGPVGRSFPLKWLFSIFIFLIYRSDLIVSNPEFKQLRI